MNVNHDIFSSRLKELRLKKNITQKELGELVGVSANTLITYEKAQKSPSLETAIKLANYFCVSLDWLCGLSENKRKIGFTTYSDVIIALNNISKTTYHHWYLIEGEMLLGFSEPEFNDFLIEWDKMRELSRNKTIDVELYNLWFEKELQRKDYETFAHLENKDNN